MELDPAGGLATHEKEGHNEVGLLAAWVRRDPSAAVAWMRQHPDSNPILELQFGSSAAERAAYLAAMLEEPSFYTQNRCGRLLSTMQRSAWRAIACNLVAKSPEAGVAALTAPGAPPLDAKTVGSVAAFLHATHPEAAANFAAALPPDLARAAAAK